MLSLCRPSKAAGWGEGMCQKTEKGGRGQIKRRARGWCRSQRADPVARDGPDPAARSGSCQTEKPDRGAAGLSGEAGVGPSVRWMDHCSNKDPLKDGGSDRGGAGLFDGARVGLGGRWRDHCSNEGFTLLLGSFCLHRKNYSPYSSFYFFQLLSTHISKKNPPPSFPFVALHLPPSPEVSRLLFVALHLPPSPEVSRLLFVALRLSVESNRETEDDGEKTRNFQREKEADGERRRRRAMKEGGDSPISKGVLPLSAGEGKERLGPCVEEEGCVV